jgi:hypothetical protein
MKLNIHIERLVLEGLPVGGNDAQRVWAAVTAELERLIRAHGVSTALHSAGAVRELHAEELKVGERSSARRLGTQIARSVYGSFGESGESR